MAKRIELAFVVRFTTQNSYLVDGGPEGERSPGCFVWVLPNRIIPKPDTHGKDITQGESLGTDML